MTKFATLKLLDYIDNVNGNDISRTFPERKHSNPVSLESGRNHQFDKVVDVRRLNSSQDGAFLLTYLVGYGPWTRLLDTGEIVT